jgi:N6-L-threonylcarbamoyladenine synthase
MLDKFGRNVGIGFPAGGAIEKLAEKACPDKYIPLPYSVKGMDVAFSGVLTAALAIHQKGLPIEDLCYSLQETTFAMLTEVTERAMAHVGKSEVILGGGVACNARLRKMVNDMARERGAVSYVPEKSLCVDNGAMIAWLGALMSMSGVRMKIADTVIDQRFRTDEVDAPWRKRAKV